MLGASAAAAPLVVFLFQRKRVEQVELCRSHRSETGHEQSVYPPSLIQEVTLFSLMAAVDASIRGVQRLEELTR